jgi:hypothetical protein
VLIAVGTEGILWGFFVKGLNVPNARDVMLMLGEFGQLAYFG